MRKDVLHLQFSSCADVGSALIRRATHSPFSHVDIVLPDGCLLGARFRGGVAVRKPNYENWSVVKQARLVTNRADKIIGLAREQIGKPYDLGALFDFYSDRFPGERDWRDPAKWFCSELVIAVMEKAGYFLPRTLRWPKNRVSPADLLLVLMFDPRFTNQHTFW